MNDSEDRNFSTWRRVSGPVYAWFGKSGNRQFALGTVFAGVGVFLAFVSSPKQSFLSNLRNKGEAVSLEGVYLSPQLALLSFKDKVNSGYPVSMELTNESDSDIIISKVLVSSSSPLCPAEEWIVRSRKDRITILKSGESKRVDTNYVLVLQGMIEYIEKKGLDSSPYIFEDKRGTPFYMTADGEAVERTIDWISNKCGSNAALKLRFVTHGDIVFKAVNVEISDPKALLLNSKATIRINALLGEIAKKRDSDGTKNLLSVARVTPLPPSPR